MGLFNRFENSARKIVEKTNAPQDYDRRRFVNKDDANNRNMINKDYETEENVENKDEDYNQYDYDEDYSDNKKGSSILDDETFSLQPSQKPESFHEFILANKFKDVEMLIRGLKYVWDKQKEKSVIKKKDIHCFTDEESENIIRTLQSNLSTDIKMSYISLESFNIKMTAIYEQLDMMFRRITEYQFGRFGDTTVQAKMKSQADNIFMTMMNRIEANYSMAIMGSENKATHQNMKGQESLNQSRGRDMGTGYT